MRPEDKLLLTLTRQNFLDIHQKIVNDLCSNRDIRWNIVYFTAKLHCVLPLVYTNLQRCVNIVSQIPREIMKQFELYCYRNVMKEKRRTEYVAKAFSFLSEKSIDIMIIKGIALGILIYEHPWLTYYTDIDLLLRLRGGNLTDKEELEIGKFLKRYDIEWGYFELSDVTFDGSFPVNFQRIWNDASGIKCLGHDVFVMSPEDMLITMCIAGCRRGFFRLKTLCDIAEIIDKCRELNWGALINKAKEYRCKNVVYTALLVTKVTLGCELPKNALDELAVAPLRALIIRYLIRFFYQRLSLASLYPFSEKNLMVNKVNVSMILSYATFQFDQFQIRRRTRQTWKRRIWGW